VTEPARITFRRASEVVAKEQKFLWRARLPIGHLTVIAGAPSKGKSTLGYRIAADADVPTIFVTTEEERRAVWRPRLEASGVDLAKAFHHPEVCFSPKSTDRDHLARLIGDYGAKLVIVDPLANHLRGASIHRDEQVRGVLEPYLELIQDTGCTLLFEVHVLRSLNPKAHPLTAVPAGVVGLAKAVYLWGDDPTIGADPNIRVLACADKFNFGPTPASLSFELAPQIVMVLDEDTGEQVPREFAAWHCRGESKVSARALIVMLQPETKERKSDRVAYVLLELLPRRVEELRQAVAELDPPISWRTAERVAQEMGVIVEDDPQDKRFKIWSLPESVQGVLDEVAGPEDEIVIEEVEIPEFPDTVPPEWTQDNDNREGDEDDDQEAKDS
jgi:AAA domain